MREQTTNNPFSTPILQAGILYFGYLPIFLSAFFKKPFRMPQDAFFIIPRYDDPLKYASVNATRQFPCLLVRISHIAHTVKTPSRQLGKIGQWLYLIALGLQSCCYCNFNIVFLYRICYDFSIGVHVERRGSFGIHKSPRSRLVNTKENYQ